MDTADTLTRNENEALLAYWDASSAARAAEEAADKAARKEDEARRAYLGAISPLTALPTDAAASAAWYAHAAGSLRAEARIARNGSIAAWSASVAVSKAAQKRSAKNDTP